MSQLTEIINDIIEDRGHEIGTHYAGCYMNHVVCLAVAVRNLLPDHEAEIQKGNRG